jgi:hypothetical protein
VADGALISAGALLVTFVVLIWAALWRRLPPSGHPGRSWRRRRRRPPPRRPAGWELSPIDPEAPPMEPGALGESGCDTPSLGFAHGPTETE